MSKLRQITDKIIARSAKTRSEYLEFINSAAAKLSREQLGCANIAHAFATIPEDVRAKIKNDNKHIGIISAYNDVLSAHEPYKDYPAIIKQAAIKESVSAQVASCVPAMCDGITQGYAGMQLSLYSRDVIAMSTAVGLSHNIFDGALFLGVCDKIVPGLLMGALRFGQLPSMFLPSGPMPSGLSNSDKSKARERYAQGLISKDELLATEMKMYHSAGTCTFYGTANSNQVMMELLGLHMPNNAFINPHTPLRKAVLEHSVAEFARNLKAGTIKKIGEMISEKSIVNAIVGLMATGGSTNHTMHLIAIARAAGIIINWDDFDAISAITPLLARIYPNGSADVNQFYEAGGLAIVVRELLENDLLHEDVDTVAGRGMHHYATEPVLKNGELVYEKALDVSRNEQIIASFAKPFSATGGLKVMSGNIGRSVIKVSAVAPENYYIKAPAVVFDDQLELLAAFERGELEKDFIAVVRFQGPKANGMPELHKLIPPLGVLMGRGHKVALITDGRMSGASGKVPAAIHTSPEALLGGAIGRIKTGDMIEFDARSGRLENLETDFDSRANPEPDLSANYLGSGRELFAPLRAAVRSAEEGASAII